MSLPSVRSNIRYAPSSGNLGLYHARASPGQQIGRSEERRGRSLRTDCLLHCALAAELVHIRQMFACPSLPVVVKECAARHMDIAIRHMLDCTALRALVGIVERAIDVRRAGACAERHQSVRVLAPGLLEGRA